MANWRQLYESWPISVDDRKRVRCIVCDKLLIYNHSTWGTLKKHAELHISKGEKRELYKELSLPQFNSDTPIRIRRDIKSDWSRDFKILSTALNGDHRVKCLICGMKMKQTKTSWSTLRRHRDQHNKCETLKVKNLPSPNPIKLCWKIKASEYGHNGNRYLVVFKTHPKIKGWISEQCLDKLHSNLGIVELPANQRLVHKLKLKRDSKNGPEIFVEFNTRPVVRAWISKENLKKLKVEAGEPIRI